MINPSKTLIWRISFVVEVKGVFNPRPQPGSHGNSEVNPHKAGIRLVLVTFLAIDFQCTLPPVERRGLALWEIGACQLVLAQSRCSPLKESSLREPSKSLDAIAGLHID